MPIYEYSCGECDREFEELIRGNEQPACPDCGSQRVERLPSVPAAHTGTRAKLPVCRADSGPQCGDGFCRTGLCDID